jgi:outer membrane biosynthesis protein TonB
MIDAAVVARHPPGVRTIMKKSSLCLLLASLCLPPLACAKRETARETTDTREAIQVAYVGAPELEVHARTDDASPVVTKFLNGESVSVLSRKGDWVEVRTADRSGWAHASDLTNAEAAAAEEKNPTPRFRVPPSPVSAPTTHGTIYIEAAVNSDGEVTSTQILVNTTGSAFLAAQNEAAIRAAKFYPIVQNGEKKKFLYDYRVDY